MLHVCGEPGCNELAQRGRCPKHQRPPWHKPNGRQIGGSGWAWQRLRTAILKRDSYICRYCGGRAVTADHVIPVARGGSDDPSNLRAACHECNERRRREMVSNSFSDTSRGTVLPSDFCGYGFGETRMTTKPVPSRGRGRPPTHGLSRSPTYKSWCAMKDRCFRAKMPRYEHYGGAGVTVCQRWQRFEGFLQDMGERPAGTTLGRIGDTGNYEPGNVKWMTSAEQAANQRSDRKQGGRPRKQAA